MSHKILLIHTRYQQKGGEDFVFEKESNLLRDNGYIVETLTLYNTNFSFIKFLLFPFNIQSYFQIRKKIKEFKPDIVHIHNFFFAASPSVFYALKKSNVPIVVTTHNFRFICPSATLYHHQKIYLKSIGKVFPVRAIFDRVYRNSVPATFWVLVSFWFHNKINTWKIIDTLIIPNPFAKSIYLQHKPLKLRHEMVVKANFICDPGFIKNPRNKSFLFVGRLSEEKGINVLLDAFKGIDQQLIIIGDGPLKHLVLQFVAENKNITYLGFKNHDEIIPILRTCSASIISSSCMEMGPLTFIESMACGTPVLASDVDTLKCFVADNFNGFLFKVNNPASLAEKVQHFDQLSTEEKERIGKNARILYEQNYTPEKSFELLNEIYTRVIDRNISGTPGTTAAS